MLYGWHLETEHGSAQVTQISTSACAEEHGWMWRLRAGAGALWRSRRRAYACNKTSSRGAIEAHRGVCDGRDVYFFKSSYREAVNKARDLGRSDRGFPLLLKLDPIPHEHFFAFHFAFFLYLSLFLSGPPKEFAPVFIYLCDEWREGGAKLTYSGFL